MTDEPANTPVTTPPVEIVATDSVPLLHVPPDVAFASVVVPFSQIVVEPVIDVVTDNGLTVSDLLAVTVPPQPLVIVYIMLQVPVALAVTTPEVAFTVAMAVLSLLHAPVPPLSTAELAL
jgi:hypothetical protein